MFKIRVKYDPGTTFGESKTVTIDLPIVWEDYDEVKRAVLRVWEHWHWIDATRTRFVRDGVQPDWHRERFGEMSRNFVYIPSAVQLSFVKDGEEVTLGASEAPWLKAPASLLGAEMVQLS